MDNEQKTLSPPADLSTAIERLMANPELIATVASVLGGARAPSVGATEENTEEKKTEDPVPSSPPVSVRAKNDPLSSDLQGVVATLSPLLSGISGGKQDDPMACLLRALKPYVSPKRRDAIDTMIRLSLLSDTLKQIR